MKCVICKSNNSAYVGAALKVGIKCDAILCKNCLSLSLKKPPSNAKITEYFAAGKSREGGVRGQFLKNIYNVKRARSQFDFMEKFLPEGYRSKNFSVLEIGSRYGFLSRIFKDLGNDVACVEPDSDCINYLKGEGIRAVPDINNIKREKFNLILLSHMLHTVPNPLAFMKEVSKRAKSNAIIFIETNNTRSAFVRENFMKPGTQEALNSLGRKSIEIVLERSGFDILKLEFTSPAYFGKGHLGTAARRFYDKMCPNAGYIKVASETEAVWLRLVARKVVK